MYDRVLVTTINSYYSKVSSTGTGTAIFLQFSTKPLKRNFQCDDGSLGLTFQLCDGIFNCRDKSNEILYKRELKCLGVGSSRNCVLPQRNLYDNLAQCKDQSDLCLNNSCF